MDNRPLIADAEHSPGLALGLTQRRDEDGHQQGNYGNHNQQLNECKGSALDFPPGKVVLLPADRPLLPSWIPFSLILR